MFDHSPRTNANRTVSSPAIPAVAAAATSSPAFGSLDSRRHSSNSSDSLALQNQRVAQIIQSTGHQTSSSAFTNRFTTAQNASQNQFYASLSAPSSSVAVNQHPHHQNRPGRPPVPLFTQGLGNQTAGKMDLQDALSLEDLRAFEGAAATSAFSSPAVGAYDMNASSASSSTTNIGTVSPQDLLIREPFSAPNSTAFTNLTSPSMYHGSPEFDSFDTSPHFGSNDFGDATAADPWFPLFPQDNLAEQVAAVNQSPAQESEELDVVESPSQSRRKSGNSPSVGGHGRHSSVSGVNSRRRDKPLPPIVVDDPSDSIAMKRARNTLAARKSRERKAQRLEDLEEKIAKLEAERDHWKRLALSRASGV